MDLADGSFEGQKLFAGYQRIAGRLVLLVIEVLKA
jgi:hypothetical protein